MRVTGNDDTKTGKPNVTGERNVFSLRRMCCWQHTTVMIGPLCAAQVVLFNWATSEEQPRLVSSVRSAFFFLPFYTHTQTDRQTDTCRLYSRFFWCILPLPLHRFFWALPSSCHTGPTLFPTQRTGARSIYIGRAADLDAFFSFSFFPADGNPPC